VSVRDVQQIAADHLPTPSNCGTGTAEVEPAVAVDQAHPNRIVAVFQEGRCTLTGGAAGIGYASSYDGGRTWAHGDLPRLTKVTGGPFDRGDDPSVAFGLDGSVYAVGMGFDVGTGCRSAVTIQRSSNDGRTFAPPTLVEDDSCQRFNDKPWVTVDTSPRSRFRGRVYVAWTQVDVSKPTPLLRILLRSSDDGGITWSAPIELARAGLAQSTPEGAVPLAQPDGSLTVLFRLRYPNGPIVARTSHDGGATFGPLVLVGRDRGVDPPHLRTGLVPAGAVDPVTGALYAVWQDRPPGTTTNVIVLSRSLDGGATWSRPRRISGGPRDGNQRFTPAVAADSGQVEVVYFRLSPTSTPVHAWPVVVASSNGGVGFAAETVIGPAAVLRFAARSGGARFLGDYLGLAATAGVAHAVWCRSWHPPNPVTPNSAAWTATITPTHPR
jgi:hypothetical protein